MFVCFVFSRGAIFPEVHSATIKSQPVDILGFRPLPLPYCRNLRSNDEVSAAVLSPLRSNDVSDSISVPAESGSVCCILKLKVLFPVLTSRNPAPVIVLLKVQLPRAGYTQSTVISYSGIAQIILFCDVNPGRRTDIESPVVARVISAEGC